MRATTTDALARGLVKITPRIAQPQLAASSRLTYVILKEPDLRRSIHLT